MARSEQLGPYRLLSELGSGGMGTVHLAEVTGALAGLEAGRKVAIKVVHPHLLESPGFFKRFIREAELGRKVLHENVVRTLDVDATPVGGEIIHYLVTEYVEGRNLRRLLGDLGTVPETLLREIARQTASGLAAIHAAGIVHRDLKPENILITDDHQVRIMDLGVAKLQQTSLAISHEAQFAGSVLYAAPEQFGSEEVEARADLYSLGVLLHELATGDNPFRRDSATAVIDAHLTFRAPRVAERNPEVSPFFSEAIATLLRKDPERRFESAEALGEVLERGERSPWWAQKEKALLEAEARLPQIAVRRETQLYGREKELEVLRGAWTRARQGEGNTILMEGEAGIGKSRLVDALLRDLAAEEAHVLYGSYAPSGGIGGISNAIVSKFGTAGLEEALRAYLDVTPSLVPAFAAIVKHESPPTGSVLLDGEGLHAVCCHLMRSLARERPLLWVVEDLHFAEPDSRQVVLSLARALEGHRVLLLGTARPGLPLDQVSHFSRLESFRRLQLGRLSPREVIELLRDAFKSDALADRLGARIAYKSDGVPFFVFEMIRGLKEERLIRELPDGSYVESEVISEIEVPSAVRDLIEARLRDLSKEERAILDVGAVQGFEFDSSLVAPVLKRERVAILQDLAEIERRSGVVRSGGGRSRFDHHQIQEVLYQALIPELRAEYHTLLAGALEDREGATAEEARALAGETACFLASHHLQGSRPREGLPFLDRALGHLERSYRNEAALELADRALAIPGLVTTEARVDLLLRKAARLDVLWRRDEERAVLDEALPLAEGLAEPGRRIRVLVQIGEHLHQVARYGEAGSILARARDLAREAGMTRLEARATRNLGNNSYHQGRNEEARRSYGRALDLARQAGDRREEAACLGGLGSLLNSLSRNEEALERFERVLAFARELDDRRYVAAARGNIGNVFITQGRYDEAARQYEEALTMAREVGNRKFEAAATGNLGVVFNNQGRFEEARRHHERHLALAREIGDPRGESVATGCLGNVAWALGRYAEALEQQERHLLLARELGDRDGEAFALVTLGIIRTGLGDWDAARIAHEESLAVCREIGARFPEGYALEGLGVLAEQVGDGDRAERLLEQALALRREIGHRDGVAESLLRLGRLLAARGDAKRARERLQEARDLAREEAAPGIALLAACHLANLPGGDAAAAQAVFKERETLLEVNQKMEACFLLWSATKQAAFLTEAHGLLRLLREHAPEQLRRSVIEKVPLHREIRAAWEEDGERER